MYKRTANYAKSPKKKVKKTKNLLTNYYAPKENKNLVNENLQNSVLNSEIIETADFFDLTNPGPSSPNQDYLNFFLNILREMENYGEKVINNEDALNIAAFRELSNPAQKLYVTLFMQKNKWVNLNTINYSTISEIIDAGNELVKFKFAQTSMSIEYEDIETVYELLFSLSVQLLEKLEDHLRNLLSQLVGDDCLDVEIEKPGCGVVIEYINNNFFKKILTKLLAMKEDVKESRKNKLIQLCAELINLLKIHTDLSSLKILPEDFPALIKLLDGPKTLYHRLDRSYNFYSSESSIQDYAHMSANNLKPIKFPVTIQSHPIYQNYNDCLIMDSVYQFYLLLEKLILYKKPLSFVYNVAKEISLLVIQPGIYTLENFIGTFKVSQIIDWKIEYTSAERWARVLNLCLDPIQKYEDWNLSLDILIYLLGQENYYIKRGHWWERIIIIVKTHLKLQSDSEKLVRLAFTDPFVRTGKRLKIKNTLEKLESTQKPKKIKKLFEYMHNFYSEHQIQAESIKIKNKLRFKLDCTAVSVEEYAISYYKLQGWTGFHSENKILTSIFGILMWEFLFEPVPYVFQTSYQKAPLDFRSDGFCFRRIEVYKRLIEAFKASQRLGKIFFEKFQLYYKQNSMFVDWASLDKWGVKFLCKAVDGLGTGLIKVLKKLCKDYRHNSSGMPDLMLVKDGEVKMVEVKSTNDKLSDQQKMWIMLLTKSNIKTEVLHIVHSTLN